MASEDDKLFAETMRSPALWLIAIAIVILAWLGLILASAAQAKEELQTDSSIALSLSLRDIAILFGVWTSTLIVVIRWLFKQFEVTRHSLRGSMDMRYNVLEERIVSEAEKLELRIRALELHNAMQDGVNRRQHKS